MGNKLFYVIVGLIIVGFVAAFFLIRDYQSNPDNLSESGYYPYTDIAAEDLNGPTVDLLDNENYHFNQTLEEVVETVQNETDGVFVYHWSPVCQFCLNATPNLIEAKDQVDANLVQLNLLEYQMAPQVFMIASTPTLVYYENGQEVERLEGDPGNSEVFAEFMQAMIDGETFVTEENVEESTDIEDATDEENEEVKEDTENEDE
ncbi:MAG TPA: thioredoxin family protein [Aliicoccus persicus]|uniref:Thioredoxin family protein n=1 Tax=Aliicoccus persicus TaxID=930138 RepID=A0A921DXS6_9STAP|nr:thioredoxin family protein [Aliicoccus persicus]